MEQALFEEADVNKALALVNKSMKQEKAFLEGMKSGGGSKSFLSGFLKLPRPSRMMYGHALQSYIWNWAVARRVGLYGF